MEMNLSVKDMMVAELFAAYLSAKIWGPYLIGIKVRSSLLKASLIKC